jgi:hypothetical protein
VPTITLRRNTRASALRGLHLSDILLHPGTWAALALATGLGLGAMARRFQLRYFKLVIAALFVLTALRSPTHIGMGLFLIVFSYPAAVWVGDTNMVLILFMLALWLGRVALKYEPAPRRTYLDWAIFFYLSTLILTLVHVQSAADLSSSWISLRHLAAPIGMYYLLVNCIRDERRLLFITEMFLLGITTVFFGLFMQRFFPGWSWLPRGYLSTISGAGVFKVGPGAIRLGGVYTHALLADATAIALVLRIYLASYYRHKRWMRVYHWFFALLSAYVLSLTGNRGGLLLLVGGVAYYLWIFRRQYSLGRILFGTALFIMLLVGSEYVLFRFESEGSLLGRVMRTQIVRGLPESRVAAWNDIWPQIKESPWIGHGLVYQLGSMSPGHRRSWPHNAYLFYAYSCGLIGLLTYLVVCWRAFFRTWVGHGLSVRDVSLARGLTAVYHVSALQFLAGQMRTDHQRGDVYVYVMWIIFALGILSRELWEQERRARPGSIGNPPPQAWEGLPHRRQGIDEA